MGLLFEIQTIISVRRTAQQFIETLHLEKHIEGGYFNEVYRSSKMINRDNATNSRNIATHIYYLLEGKNYSAFHKLSSEELWHHYYGAPICIHILEENSPYRKIILSADYEGSISPFFNVPADSWFAVELIDKHSFALAGCTVIPGFEYDDFTIGKKEMLYQKFPQHKELISKLLK